MNVLLCAIVEHYNLRHSVPGEESQLRFEMNSKDIKCLVYREDTVTKTHDGGLNDMRKDRKIVWVYPSENIHRCPVRLVENIYLCPKFTRNKNFYLQSLPRPTPKQLYGCQVMGLNSILKVIKTLMEEANIEGLFY